jgi:SMI1 / KNR4 family (SUKH-1)
MATLTLVGSKSEASNKSLSELERLVNCSLPPAFKSLYSRWNGGTPSLDWFPASDGFEPIWIHEFLPIQIKLENRGEVGPTIQSVREIALARGLIANDALPFAVDPGGNLFCLRIPDGSVFFWTNHDPNSTESLNGSPRHPGRTLCGTFEEFLQMLVSEDDAFG